ncbi:MAG: stage III sporulation protein AF [Bacilli bacterium]
MEWLNEWIRNIVVLILVGTLLELFMPSGAYQKYTRFVLGLIMIITFLTPVLQLLQVSPEEMVAEMEQNASVAVTVEKNVLEQKKIDIETGQAAYIVEKMNESLKNDANVELESLGYEVVQVEVVVNPNIPLQQLQYQDIQHVSLMLKQRKAVVSPVQTVEINKQDNVEAENDETLAEIVNKLAARWGIHEKKISILS